MGLKNSWLKSLALKSSWLKSLGLKGPGLKLGVEKSEVEMCFVVYESSEEFKVNRLMNRRP